MKVLLCHNFYNSNIPSGEGVVFEAEKRLLKGRQHNVETFTRSSDEIIKWGLAGKIIGGIASPWNFSMQKAVRRKVEIFEPDLVHFHNTFPLFSPAVFHGLRGRTATVLTLHNYRLFCAAAIPMREGRVCTECLSKRSSWPSLIHGCYRGSRLATAPLAASIALHRMLGTWKHEVDAFIALSDFQRQLMIDSGLPSEKVHVKPNFYPGDPSQKKWADRSPHVVFAGRLTAEKGLLTLMRAWKMWGSMAPELHIIGDGELRTVLENMAQGLPVRFLGQLSPPETQAHIASASLLVLPSEWFEGFPMVVREAFAFGTPAAVSNLGPLPSIVRHSVNGLVFEAANPESLLSTVRAAWHFPGALERLGTGARQAFDSLYNEDENYRLLMHIYESAIGERDRRRLRG